MSQSVTGPSIDSPNQKGPPLMSVSQLNRELNDCVSHYFKQVWLKAEVGPISDRRHLYFTLKEGDVSIKAIIWHQQRAHLKYEPKEGDEVLVRADVSVYGKRGDCSLTVTHMELTGEGQLLKELEARRERLIARGAFGRSRPLPVIPRGVALITAQGKEAEVDFRSTAQERAPGVPIYTFDARMQGSEAQVVAGLKDTLMRAASDPRVDVLVLTRGGGSIEDLWVFHNEELCLFISQSPLPIVVAIGHERNQLLSEEASDRRVSTPTAAANAVIPDVRVLRQELRHLERGLAVGIERHGRRAEERLRSLTETLPSPPLMTAKHTLSQLSYQLESLMHAQLERRLRVIERADHLLGERAPLVRLARVSEGLKEAERSLLGLDLLSPKLAQLERLEEQLTQGALTQLQRAEGGYQALIGTLHALSPLGVLSRGYSITKHNARDEVLHKSDQAEPGDELTITLSEGRLKAQVLERLS